MKFPDHRLERRLRPIMVNEPRWGCVAVTCPLTIDLTDDAAIDARPPPCDPCAGDPLASIANAHTIVSMIHDTPQMARRHEGAVLREQASPIENPGTLI